MLKKILSTVATAALALTGLSAAPANAATPADVPFVPLSNMGQAMTATNLTGANFTDGKIPVPANAVSNMNVNTNVSLNATWVAANKGKTLTVSFSVKDKDGNDVKSLSDGGDLYGYLGGYAVTNGRVQTSTGSYYFGANIWNQPSAGLSNVPGNSLTIPADGGNITSITANAYAQIQYKPLEMGATLPAGTYTLQANWMVDGVPVPLSVMGSPGASAPTYAFWISTLNWTIPSIGTPTTISHSGNLGACVDSTKVAAGDVVAAELWIDGVKQTLLQTSNIYGNFQTRSRANTTNAAYRQGGGTFTGTTVVTAFDVTDGLAFWANWNPGTGNNIGSWAAGSTHTFGVKLYNQTTNVDVSGSCKPGRTGVPTITTLANGDMEVAVSRADFAMISYCVLYDKAAPTKIVGFSNTAIIQNGILMGSDQGTCTFKKELFVAGHVYEVDTFSGFWNAFGYAQGATTDGSKPLLQGAGGSSSGSGIKGTTPQNVTFNAPTNAAANYVGSSKITASGTATAGVALSYSSATPSICTVDATTGKVTAIAAGDCTITASNSGDETYAAFSKDVTFAIAPIGSTTQTSTVAAPSNAALNYVGSTGINVGGTAASGEPVTYTSSTPSVCTVDAATGQVTAIAAGDCSITATAPGNATYAALNKTVTFPITAGAAGTTAQTFNVTAPSNLSVNLEGFDLQGSSSSGLAIIYTSSTPDVCTIDAAGHLTTLKAGTCKIVVTQPGDATYAPTSQEFTYVIAASATTEVAVTDSISKPLTLGASGTITSRESVFTWKRSTGAFGYKIKVLYIGPVKVTASWKVGTKKYSCVVNFGLLKKQSSAKLLTLTAPNFCTAKTEKTQLAALKKIPKNTVVSILINRTWYTPTTYTKIRPWKRVTYVKLG